MLEFIKHIVYINLDKRQDRRAEIVAELERVFPADRFQRFPAIRHAYGAIGCSKSHIAILEMAKENKWENVLIVEDDFTWQNLEEGVKDLERYEQIPFDVVLLGGAFTNSVPVTNRVISAQTTVGYLVKAHYYDTLLENFKESMNALCNGMPEQSFALDQHWKKLQARDTWYIVRPMLCYQRASYSDICKSYRDLITLFK